MRLPAQTVRCLNVSVKPALANLIEADKHSLMLDLMRCLISLTVAVGVFMVLVLGALWLVEMHCRGKQLVCQRSAIAAEFAEGVRSLPSAGPQS